VNPYRTLLAAGIGSLLLMPSASAAPDVTKGMALMSAAVAADATLVHGSGVVIASRSSAGVYSVFFDWTVSGCTFVGTIGPANAGTAAGMIDVAPSTGMTGVRVETRETTGVLTDKPFHLIVFCTK
jgi:hypothetical protein